MNLSWNLDLLKVYIHSDDVSVIQSIAISFQPKPDSYGWHFTDHGQYTVNSGYRLDKLYPDGGPTINFQNISHPIGLEMVFPGLGMLFMVFIGLIS